MVKPWYGRQPDCTCIAQSATRRCGGVLGSGRGCRVYEVFFVVASADSSSGELAADRRVSLNPEPRKHSFTPCASGAADTGAEWWL